MQPLEIAEAFLHTYFGQDRDATMRLISDDFEWISMCMPERAIRGRAATHHLVYEQNFGLPEPFRDGHHRTVCALHSDGIVMHERVDYFTMRDRQIEVPCCATFQLRGEQICAWRDYFDRGNVVKQMLEAGVVLPSSNP
jgi:limonene-1,2-epoxide hydrolase